MATVGTALGTVSTLLVMMILVVLSREARGGYTCSAVTTRLKTQVVCYFDLNVKEYAYSFKVQFYSRDDRKMANPENILRCDYTSHGKLQCQNATGDVTFDGVVSDQLTLTRPASPDKAGGQYVCRLEQPQPEMRFDPCVLTYLETPTTPATSTTPPTSTPATATVLANDKNTVHVAAVIVPYILVVICVAVIVYMSRDRLKTWRRQLRIWWNQRVNRPQNPAGERDAEACLMNPDNNATGDHDKVLRVVIVGKTAAGKSELGNNLLGKKAFKVCRGLQSETNLCSWDRAERDGVLLEVMDSPGLGHTDKEDWVICNMLAKSVALADPGPNVIIFAIRHHSGYSETFKKIKQLFSNEVKKYLIIVFIGMDEVGDKNASIDDRRKRLCEDISKSDNLQQMVGEASGGFFGMNNKTQREKQAQDLIKIMQNLVRQNKGECYKSDMTEQIRCSVEELVRSKLETNE